MLDPTDPDVIRLKMSLKRCHQIWWSPIEGSAYVRNHVGPGRIALKAPGVFNLYWALTRLPFPDHPKFEGHHRNNVLVLSGLAHLGKLEVRGFTLNEWAVNLRPKAFYDWLKGIPANEMHPFPPIGHIRSPKQLCRALKKVVAELE